MKRRKFIKVSLGGICAAVLAPLLSLVHIKPKEIRTGLGRLPRKSEGGNYMTDPDAWFLTKDAKFKVYYRGTNHPPGHYKDVERNG